MKRYDSLVISEKFYSIQGEGRTTGFPAIFLRLSGCNLLCQSENWVCDSIKVWKKGTKTAFEDVFTDEEINHLKCDAHLVITGGEPLLHQSALIDFLHWFERTHFFIPYIEIETNGTIEPSGGLLRFVKNWNVSPKLSTSGEIKPKRYNEDALRAFNMYPQTMFKFVISVEEDIDEIFSDFGWLQKKKITLMPAGENQKELNKIRLMVIELCKKHYLKYCDRLHIVAWNKKTGV